MWFRPILYFFLFLEAVWAILWTTSMLVFQFHPGGTDNIRITHAIMMSHAVMAASLISIIERRRKVVLIWMLFVVMTDLYSTLESFLHIHFGEGDMLTLLHANAIVGIVLSGLGTLWYAVVVFSAVRTGTRVRQAGAYYGPA